MKKKFWIAFFSHTGIELCRLIKQSGRVPDLIVTNNYENVDESLGEYTDLIKYIPAEPTAKDYNQVLDDFKEMENAKNKDILITLQGWTRVIPARICNKYKVVLFHIGTISLCQGLFKGYDPQDISLCRKTTDQLDSGKILKILKNSIEDCDTLETVYEKWALIDSTHQSLYLRKNLKEAD